MNADVDTIQLYGIGMHPTDPDIVLGGSQDNGTGRFSGSLGWVLVDGGDGALVKFSRQNGNLVYRASPPVPSPRKITFAFQPTRGRPGVPRPTASTATNSRNWVTPFSVDATNGERVVLGTYRLYETTNGATSWSSLSAVNVDGWNPTGVNVDAIGLAASDANTIYAATGGQFAASSNIYLTTNHGAGWVVRNLPSGSGRVSDLQVDPTNAQIVYATISTFSGGRVFQTTNGGQTWNDISGNLPALPTWSLQLNPTQANTLYAGNDTGVYITTNLGASWNRMGSDLPNAQVRQLELNTTTGILAAATHGRGAWEILTNNPPLTGVTFTASPASPQPAGTAITITASATGGTNVQYQFWVYNPAATPAWSQLQAYSTPTTCSWTPGDSRQLPALRHRAGRHHRHGGEYHCSGIPSPVPLDRGDRYHLARLAAAGRYADHPHRDGDGRHECAVPVLGV